MPFVVSQNWNPDGGVGVYNNVAVGLSYGSFWQIFNQNFSALPPNGVFNPHELGVYYRLALGAVQPGRRYARRRRGHECAG